jgi:hypothetical protein
MAYCSAVSQPGEYCYYCNECTCGAGEMAELGGSYNCCAYSGYAGGSNCNNNNVILQVYNPVAPSPPPAPTCSGSYGTFKNPSICPAYVGHSATAGLPYCSAAAEGELCYYCEGCTCSNQYNALGGYTCCAYNLYSTPKCGNSNIILEKVSSLMAAFDELDAAAKAENLALTKSNEAPILKAGAEQKAKEEGFMAKTQMQQMESQQGKKTSKKGKQVKH